MTHRYFLCQEDADQFCVKAKDLTDAKSKATYYNAEVIREMTKKEIAKIPNP